MSTTGHPRTSLTKQNDLTYIRPNISFVFDVRPLAIPDIDAAKGKRVQYLETNQLLYMDHGWLMLQSKNCRIAVKLLAEIK